jgi:hypothetical protein
MAISEDHYLTNTMDALRLLGPRNIAALYYGTWRLLVDAQDNQTLPRLHRLAHPGGRIELANQYHQLLAEAILLLPSESLDMAMRDPAEKTPKWTGRRPQERNRGS